MPELGPMPKPIPMPPMPSGRQRRIRDVNAELRQLALAQQRVAQFAKHTATAKAITAATFDAFNEALAEGRYPEDLPTSMFEALGPGQQRLLALKATQEAKEQQREYEKFKPIPTEKQVSLRDLLPYSGLIPREVQALVPLGQEAASFVGDIGRQTAATMTGNIAEARRIQSEAYKRKDTEPGTLLGSVLFPPPTSLAELQGPLASLLGIPPAGVAMGLSGTQIQRALGATVAPTQIRKFVPPPSVLPGEVMQVPTVESIKAITTGKLGRVRRVLAGQPLAKKVIGAFTKLLTADNPMDEAIVVRGFLEEFSNAAVADGVRRARLLDSPPKKITIAGKAFEFPGIERRLIKTDPAGTLAIDPGIKQIKLLPGKRKSMALHDIVEYSKRYSMTRPIRALVDEIRKQATAIVRYAESQGMNIPRMKGESDWVYLHRVVITAKSEEVKTLAKSAGNMAGVPPQPVGQSSWAYLQNIMKRLKEGSIPMTPELNSLAEATAKITNVKVRSFLQMPVRKKRWYELALDGLDAGIAYAQPVDELESMFQATYKTISNNRVAEILKEVVRSPYEMAAPALKAARTATANRASVAVWFKRDLEKAISKVQPLSAESITKFGRQFPEEAREIQRVMRQFQPKAIQAHRELLEPPFYRQGSRMSARKVGTIFTEAERKEMNLESALSAMHRYVSDRATSATNLAKRAKEAAERSGRSAASVAEEGKLSVHVGIPGISGFIAPATQVIRGKTLRGKDVAKAINDAFAYLEPGYMERALDGVVYFSGMYRLGKTGYDMGIWMIQLMGAMGMDFINLTTYPAAKVVGEMAGKAVIRKPTAIFPRAAKASFVGFVDPRYEAKYFLNPAKRAAMVEGASYGMLKQSSEWSEAANVLQAQFGKVPKIGNVLKGITQQTFGRADAAFSAGRNIGGNELWIAFREMAESTGNLKDLAQLANLVTGVLSLKAAGTPRLTQKTLSGLIFLAPRYTASQFALIARIFSGGMSTELALRAVFGMFLANTAITTAMATALGQKPRLDPRPKSMGGDGADMWTIQVGDRKMGIGGGLYQPLRFISNTASASLDNPSALIRFDMTSPIVRFFRGKGAGFPGTLWDYATGRDFLGEPVRGMGRMVPTKETEKWAKWRFAPIWAETFFKDDGGVAPTVLEWFGYRVHPVTMFNRYRVIIEQIASKPFDEISNNEQALIRADYDEAQEAYDEAREDGAQRGWNPKMTDYFRQREDEREIKYRRASDSWDKMYEDPLFSIEDFKRQLATSGDAYRGALARIDRNSPDIVDRLGEPRDKRLIPDIIEAQVWDIILDKDLRDKVTDERDYDEIDRRIDAVKNETIQEYDEETWNEAMEGMSASRRNAPYGMQEYWWALEMLRPFFQAYKLVLPEDQWWDYKRFKKLDGINREGELRASPWLRQAEKLVSGAKEQARAQNQLIDMLAYRWGYTSLLLHPDNDGREAEFRPWVSASQAYKEMGA